MLSIHEIKSRLEDNLPSLAKKYPIGALSLFGSYVRGEETENSDIDIMVEFNGDIGWEYFDLHSDLAKLFAGKKVDLISKGGIQPHYWEYLKNKFIYVGERA
jgi:predicted nucleotidyltransferase